MVVDRTAEMVQTARHRCRWTPNINSRVGHYRLPLGGVLHYDRDYDILAGKTDLRFASVWLARRGSL